MNANIYKSMAITFFISMQLFKWKMIFEEKLNIYFKPSVGHDEIQFQFE